MPRPLALPLLLAQFGDAGSVPELPRPPFLEHTLFESPLPLVGLLFLAGVVAFFMLNSTGRAKQGLIAAGSASALALGTLLIASLVTTTRETLQARTTALVHAAATADTTALAPLLADDVRLVLWDQTAALGRPRTLDLVNQYTGTLYKLREHSITRTTASVDGRNAARTLARVRVRTEATLYDIPIGSTWRIDWRLENDNSWRATAITCLQIDGVGSRPPDAPSPAPKANPR